MPPRSGVTGAVAGTLQAFNFIRRVAFPSTPAVTSIFCTLVLLPVIIGLPSVGVSPGSSFLYAVCVLILPVVAAEGLIAGLILKRDHVLNFRRLLGLELVSWLPFPPLLLLFSVGESAAGRVGWEGGLFLSIGLSLPVRFLTIGSISSQSTWRKSFSSSLVPAAILVAHASLAPVILNSSGAYSVGWLVFVSALMISGTGVWLIIRGVESSGSPTIGASPMGLFRSFLRHWLSQDREHLERELARVGSEGEAETAIIAFSGRTTSVKGCIIVSDIHPGPYRDLGSGGLPSSLKVGVEVALGGVAMVPHGISNHENNLTSHTDVSTLVVGTVKNYPSKYSTSTATRFVRGASGTAKASAQAFGDLVLITMTLAPHEMEDIPHQVLRDIQQAASERGLKVVAVDAHNSLKGQTSITPVQAADLTEAAVRALTTVAQLPQTPFMVGAAEDPLQGFSLEDGIGPGGLSVIVVRVEDQIVSYTTVDGNNMQVGLREAIQELLGSHGVSDGEVMTTDTHLVTGLVTSPLGYHPVGDGIDKSIFLEAVEKCLVRAVESLEESRVGFSSFKKTLRVLGSGTFSSITSFISAVGRRVLRSFLFLEFAILVIASVVLVLG